MSEKNNTVPSWLNTAVRGIRFGPDRRAVEAELRGHIEDKAADLARIFPDMTPEEAEARALSEMGDPAEIGKELAKIHKPWLGYLWVCSLGALWILILAIALMLWRDLAFRAFRYPPLASNSSYFSEGVEEFVAAAWFPEGGVARAEVAAPPPVSVGGYTVSVEEAALLGAAAPGKAGEDRRFLYVILAVEHRRPWESIAGLNGYLWAEDDRGRRIASAAEVENLRLPEDYMMGRTLLSQTVFRERYEFLIPVSDAAAERIDLRYTRMGADLTIPIPLEEETP